MLGRAMGLGISNFFSRIFSSEALVAPVEAKQTRASADREVRDRFDASAPVPTSGGGLGGTANPRASGVPAVGRPRNTTGSRGGVPTNTAGHQRSLSLVELIGEGRTANATAETPALATTQDYDRELAAFAEYKGLFLKSAVAEFTYFKANSHPSDYAATMKTATAEYNKTASVYFARLGYRDSDAEALAHQWKMPPADAIGFAAQLLQNGMTKTLDATLAAAKASITARIA